MCPACWPAYAAALSSVGLGFLISTNYLLPVTALFVALAVASLAFRASRRRGLAPFWAGIIGAMLILAGKFYLESRPTTYAGVSLLILASVWNSWPRRATKVSCAGCLPAEDSSTRKNVAKKGYNYEAQD
jgi:hypothetical protein